MLRERTILFLIVIASLVLGAGLPARAADFGAGTKLPPSDPLKATIDQGTAGAWYANFKGKPYYLHAGTGNIVGKSNWMELVLVNQGKEKPSFYVYHRVGFTCTVGDSSFFALASMSKQVSQLRGAKTEDLAAAVDKYEIFKYKLDKDIMDVWAVNQKFLREAIQTGKIKGNAATIDDTTENLINFMKESEAKLFTRRIRYIRVTEPKALPPPEKKK
jgi:hypothetical protein